MDIKSAEWRPGPNNTVCRCCLAEGCYKDISTEYFWMGKREVYSEMLQETFDIGISYSQSGGPNSNSRLICEPCISRLRDASEFKRQVQECEKTFMQHLDPVSSASTIVEVPPVDKVKLETVKLEKSLSDDDFDARYDDDDDDDLDDQPLTKLKMASKVPKKESVDLLDLLDNTSITVKRKSLSKIKAVPAKKAKTKKEVVKATSSKTTAKPVEPPKKKKEKDHYTFVRRNAELIVKYTTAYPFRLPEDSMVCVYCCESYDDPAKYRQHMHDDHQTFQVRMAFSHCHEGDLKVDVTALSCRICAMPFENLHVIAQHLYFEHDLKINVEIDLGMQPFKLDNNQYVCAICDTKCPCLRQLSRHTQSHFLRHTCDLCGKSYATLTALKHHMTFSHIKGERICRKCRKTFDSLEDKRKHLNETPRCWSYLCGACGKRFMTWAAKQAHMTQVHNAPKKSYACRECGLVFDSRKKYRAHFKIEHTDDNFMCSCCGQKFDTKRSLEEHRVVHTKERLFPCNVCSKSFPRKKNLAQHMWVHSEVKRFECVPCNKQFNQRVSWKTHMKSYHPDVIGFEE